MNSTVLPLSMHIFTVGIARAHEKCSNSLCHILFQLCTSLRNLAFGFAIQEMILFNSLFVNLLLSFRMPNHCRHCPRHNRSCFCSCCRSFFQNSIQIPHSTLIRIFCMNVFHFLNIFIELDVYFLPAKEAKC